MSQRLRSAIPFHLRYANCQWRGAEEKQDPPAGDPPKDPPQGDPPKEPPAGEPPKDPPAETVSKADFDALMARMQAADRAKAEAEGKVKEYEDKGKSELEKAQAAADEAAKERDALAEAVKQTRIENKFLASNKHTWHNPEMALKNLDMSLITIEDDGTVKGVDAAVDKLAKDHPYLIKPPSDGEGGNGPSGNGNDGKGGGKNKLDRAALERKYPALRRG